MDTRVRPTRSDARPQPADEAERPRLAASNRPPQTVSAHSSTPAAADAQSGLLAAAGANRALRVKHDLAWSAIFRVVAAAAMVYLAVRLSMVGLLIVMSLMLVATFNPLVRWLQAHVSRGSALAVVIVTIIGAIVLPVVLVSPVLFDQGSSLIKNLPAYLQALQTVLSHHGIHVSLQNRFDEIAAYVAAALPQMYGVLSTVMHNLVAMLTVVVLTIYLLIEGPEIASGALRMLPKERRLGVRRLFADIGTSVGAYVRGQLILSATAGAFFLLLLLAMGVPDALLLALVAAVADAIPLAGLIIALIPACLTALAMSTTTAGTVAVVYLVYHQVEANVLAPRIFGQSLGLRVSMVVIAIVIGVELLGILGAVLALPVAAALPAIVRYLWELHEDITNTPPSVEGETSPAA